VPLGIGKDEADLPTRWHRNYPVRLLVLLVETQSRQVFVCGGRGRIGDCHLVRLGVLRRAPGMCLSAGKMPKTAQDACLPLSAHWTMSSMTPRFGSAPACSTSIPKANIAKAVLMTWPLLDERIQAETRLLVSVNTFSTELDGSQMFRNPTQRSAYQLLLLNTAVPSRRSKPARRCEACCAGSGEALMAEVSDDAGKTLIGQ
jgi:hypothetical protein